MAYKSSGTAVPSTQARAIPSSSRRSPRSQMVSSSCPVMRPPPPPPPTTRPALPSMDPPLMQLPPSPATFSPSHLHDRNKAGAQPKYQRVLSQSLCTHSGSGVGGDELMRQFERLRAIEENTRPEQDRGMMSSRAGGSSLGHGSGVPRVGGIGIKNHRIPTRNDPRRASLPLGTSPTVFSLLKDSSVPDMGGPLHDSFTRRGGLDGDKSEEDDSHGHVDHMADPDEMLFSLSLDPNEGSFLGGEGAAAGAGADEMFLFD